MMMMMTFGGFNSAYQPPMMNAGATAAYGNPQAGFQQGQPAFRSGGSQFPPPVEGNPYEPKRKKHDNFQLSMPDADWGQVTIGTGTGALVGAGAGALVGILDNVAQPPETRYIYELDNNGVKHKLRFEQNPNVKGRINTVHIEQSGSNASPIKARIDYEYTEQGLLKQLFKQPESNIPKQVHFNIDNNGNSIETSLQRKGWLRKHYELLDATGKRHTYKFESGVFNPTANSLPLHEALPGLPKNSVMTTMPSNITAEVISPLESGKLFRNLGGKIGLAAAIGGLAFGGYQTWKTSQDVGAKKLALIAQHGTGIAGYPPALPPQPTAFQQPPLQPQMPAGINQTPPPPMQTQGLLRPPTPPNQLGYGG